MLIYSTENVLKALLIVAIEKCSVASSSCIEMASRVDGSWIPDDGFCCLHWYGLITDSGQKYCVSWNKVER